MIHVENLTKYYNDLCAVDQISFDIHKGEILGLLGPNGAGKTTTLRMLTGFIKPTSGSISVQDYSITEKPLEIKKLLGYLPESAPLYYDILVYDYLKYVADIWGIDNSKKMPQIKNLVDLCGLGDVMHKPIGELSKGYKQRVGLAHAMMSDPEILILDEPTSGLDPNQRVEIRNIIKQIGKEKTIILSTHILSEAEATCNRVIIINRGKIAADDSTQSLKNSHGGTKSINMSLWHPDFKIDFESVKKELEPVKGVEGIMQAEDDGEATSVILNYGAASDIRSEIYKKIKHTDWIILEFHQESGTLESIFRELTRGN